ncbi:Cyclin-dependent kinase inhibitor [Arabidopsis suecica]|uniref:Cyclin-dependent kinase inhibitor n=1 Tax=Arabidopsis suecica TaxID=45249 RepID=A0A8T2CP97_ARASU|nr:Cyclin-dependent kinase inhibitor [Arabidopsis suecica]
MSLREMSETKSKRDSDYEGSNIKRMRLDDDDGVLRSPTRTLSSSSSSSLAYSVSDSGGFCSVALSEEEDDHRSSSIISSGCSSSETNEIATRLPFSDLEAHEISETEISTLITNNNFSKQGSPLSENLGETAEMDSATTERRDQRKTEKKMEKSPTQAELDDFFSAAERFQQKRFTEKYNYDIVNDTPLEGRYQWVSLKP